MTGTKAKTLTNGVLLALLGTVATIGLSGQQAGSNVSAAVSERELLDKYCVTCHSEKLKTGGLSLQRMDFSNAPAEAETWENVILKLRSGAMPPPGMPRPDHAVIDSVASSLEASLDRAAAAKPNPGQAPLRRLNR